MFELVIDVPLHDSQLFLQILALGDELRELFFEAFEQDDLLVSLLEQLDVRRSITSRLIGRHAIPFYDFLFSSWTL
jgi:hypothetical protein